MDDAIPSQRASRDFRVKFPDDVMQDNLGGQLWFGAEVSSWQIVGFIHPVCVLVRLYAVLC